MAGKKSRRKGYVGEKEFRDICSDRGYELIWHNEDPSLPDITLKTKKTELTTEIKYSKSVPKKLYKWFSEKNPQILATRRISKSEHGLPWLVTMTVEQFFELLK